MNDSYTIRRFRDDDFAAEARIETLVFPVQPVSEEECRTWDRAVRNTGLFKEALVADETSSGKVAATGAVSHAPFSYDPDWYWVSVGVDPSHQHQGIGTELYRRLESTAVRRGAKGLWAAVQESQPRSVTFFERAGFYEQRRGWVSELDLTGPPTDFQLGPSGPTDYPGIQLTTLAEMDPNRPETIERLYRLDRDAGQDAPRMGPANNATLEQFCEITLDPGTFLPEGIFVARVGDEFVSMTTLCRLPAEPKALWTPFTGTRKEYRGRGLALALKRRAIAFARSRGYHYIRTGNDSLNAPMWSINERLGFQKKQTMIFGEKKLKPPI